MKAKREKTGVSWCNQHQRYETLFAVRPMPDPHIPDGDAEGPTPDHSAYLMPAVDAAPPPQARVH